jgi:hypothetical protein
VGVGVEEGGVVMLVSEELRTDKRARCMGSGV